MIGIVLLYLLAAGVAAAHELTAGAGFWITVTPYLVGALALIGGVVAQIAGARKRRRQPGIIGVAVTAVATLLLLSLVSPWLMVPLGLGWMAWRVLRWHFDRFMLTDKRVVAVHGVITRYIAMSPLAQVADMKYEQTPMGPDPQLRHITDRFRRAGDGAAEDPEPAEPERDLPTCRGGDIQAGG